MIKELFLLERNGKKINKKGWLTLIVWGVAALVAAGGYFLNASKPAPTGINGFISSIPIWGWIVIGLVALVLLRGRN